MKNLTALFQDIENRTFRVTTTASGKEKLQQTERNGLRAELMDKLLADLAESGYRVARGKDGVLVEIPNGSVADGVSRNSIGSGAITLAFEVKVKDLDSELEYLADEYTEHQEEQARKEAERKAKAQRKRERDEQLRASKRGG